jgi:hypothetical protein
MIAGASVSAAPGYHIHPLQGTGGFPDSLYSGLQMSATCCQYRLR